MPEDGEPPAETTVVERRTPDEVFELLKNETRLAILEALFEADGPRTFSELRRAADVRDSGQFSYHLDKLRDVFVEETGGEETKGGKTEGAKTQGAETEGEGTSGAKPSGYDLTTAGHYLVGSLFAGEYTKAYEGADVPVGADCPHCGGELVAAFERDDRVRLGCAACDRTVLSLRVPPGALEAHPREAWPRVAERWTRRELATIRMGFCPVCYGPVESRLSTDPEGVWEGFAASVAFECRRCGSSLTANAEAAVVTHPAVVGFLHERGVDPADTPVWELEWAIEPAASVVSEDPPRVEVPIGCDGDRLVLVLDGSGTVVEERRD